MSEPSSSTSRTTPIASPANSEVPPTAEVPRLVAPVAGNRAVPQWPLYPTYQAPWQPPFGLPSGFLQQVPNPHFPPNPMAFTPYGAHSPLGYPMLPMPPTYSQPQQLVAVQNWQHQASGNWNVLAAMPGAGSTTSVVIPSNASSRPSQNSGPIRNAAPAASTARVPQHPGNPSYQVPFSRAGNPSPHFSLNPMASSPFAMQYPTFYPMSNMPSTSQPQPQATVQNLQEQASRTNHPGTENGEQNDGPVNVGGFRIDLRGMSEEGVERTYNEMMRELDARMDHAHRELFQTLDARAAISNHFSNRIRSQGSNREFARQTTVERENTPEPELLVDDDRVNAKRSPPEPAERETAKISPRDDIMDENVAHTSDQRQDDQTLENHRRVGEPSTSGMEMRTSRSPIEEETRDGLLVLDNGDVDFSCEMPSTSLGDGNSTSRSARKRCKNLSTSRRGRPLLKDRQGRFTKKPTSIEKEAQTQEKSSQPKPKRGRPPKSSTEEEAQTQEKSSQPKPKRGRPPKSSKENLPPAEQVSTSTSQNRLTKPARRRKASETRAASTSRSTAPRNLSEYLELLEESLDGRRGHTKRRRMPSERGHSDSEKDQDEAEKGDSEETMDGSDDSDSEDNSFTPRSKQTRKRTTREKKSSKKGKK